MANNFNIPMGSPVSLGLVGTQSKTGLLLDTAYVYNSAGKAVAGRFCAPVSSNLTDVYFFSSAIGGTPGNLTFELRNCTSNTKPGTTLHASQTNVAPAGAANKWVRCTFSTPFSCVRGDTYFVVVGDAAGGGTNNSTILTKGGLSSFNAFAQGGNSLQTTDGFASVQTNNNVPIPMVLKFADGTKLGNPYTTTGSYTSNTRERGIKVVSFTEQIIINCISLSGGGTVYSGLKIYSGATVPGGTTDLTVTFGLQAASIGFAMFAPFTFLKNTVYRVVLTFGSSTTGPSYFNSEDMASFADVVACGFGGGTIYDTIDNGSGGWTDNTDRMPQMALGFQDQVAISASSSVAARGLLVGQGTIRSSTF